MTPEDRLREAIEARAASVEPASDGLDRIELGLAQAQRHDRRRRLLMRVTSAAAVVAVAVVAIAVTRDDEQVVTDQPTPTTASTTTTEPTTTTTALTPVVDPAVPVWPRVHTSQRFDDPAAAAHSFAVDFVGMTDPVVGVFQQGDSRSGEVPVQPRADGPVTTVIVRQLEDDTWYVLGASTDDIRLDTPTALSDIDCPVRLTGEALAFEGTVQVAIRDDYTDEPIGTGFVTGGGGPSAPFDDEVQCDLDLLDDGIHSGAIVLYTEGGEDYRIWQATVVRVALK